MTVYFYNTLTRKKEEFIPLKPGHAGIYTCGPTVYAYAHIGNMRAYVFADTLRRVMERAGFDVNHVMNITDVGHLVSDGDDGEDKMEVGKKREGLTAWKIAEKYTDAFFDHTAKLNILRPNIVCKATDHIAEQIAMIKKLEEKGYAYTAQDGVYFDTSKFKSYGEMARLDIEGLEGGHRITADAKKHKTDFALWKFSPAGQQRDMEWESPWGKGFPGWHIECSAMSVRYLGEQFDIHTGGIDHIPVHHTNEIAQTEGATGKTPFVRYWLHGEFLQMDESVKMSKSKGDALTVDTLIEKGYDPLAFRYLCLTAHYRNPLKFSWDSLDQAAAAYARLLRHVIELREKTKPAATLSDAAAAYRGKFLEAVTDDLNTAKGLSVLHEAVRDEILPPEQKLALLLELDGVLGLNFATAEKKETAVPQEVVDLAQQRDAARKEKRWADADSLRAQIEKLGYSVEDTKDGPKFSTLS